MDTDDEATPQYMQVSRETTAESACSLSFDMKDEASPDVRVAGRSMADVVRLATCFELPQNVVVALLKVHGESLEDQLLTDRDAVLRLAGLSVADEAQPARTVAASPSDVAYVDVA